MDLLQSLQDCIGEASLVTLDSAEGVINVWQFGRKTTLIGPLQLSRKSLSLLKTCQNPNAFEALLVAISR